nr:ATP-binding protein [uncultured Caproiciproducens sp.]
MNNTLSFDYVVPGDDFTRAGEASSDVKHKLKQIGYDSDAIRRVAIAMYEGEINMVIHAGGGQAHVEISPEKIEMILADQGPGIKDIALAMREGYSTAPDNVRALGFGAGMGMSNMKKCSDTMEIDTKVGKGTTLRMTVFAKKEQ